MNSETGRELWRFRTMAEILSSPAVASKIVYFNSADNHVYAVDAETGKKNWKFKTRGVWMRSSPAIADGMLYFGCDDSYLYALR
jgi:outer membrane protein assembly factor BamB